MNRTGLWPVGSPYEIILVTYIRAFHGFFACSLTTESQCSCAGNVQVPVDFILAWEHPHDYVCWHRADSCGCHIRAWEYPYDQSCRAVVGPMRPVTALSCYIYQVKPDYVLFDP